VNKNGNILAVLSGAVALIPLSLAAYLFFQNQNLQKSFDFAQDKRPAPSPTIPDETANWKTYENQRFGFSFKYPQRLNLQEKVFNGETGFVFYLSSSATDFAIGGVSPDFSAGRSGDFLDTQGYRKDRDIIYYKFVGSKESIIPSNLISGLSANSNGVEIVKTFGKSSPGSPFPISGTPGDGYIGALINLNSSEIGGLGVSYKIGSVILTEKEFNQILGTFRVLE
jgi:hypothetical protein